MNSSESLVLLATMRLSPLELCRLILKTLEGNPLETDHLWELGMYFVYV